MEYALPPWLAKASAKDDPLKDFFSEFRDLWKHGEVVWGRVIKANYQLFEHGAFDCPGDLLFCPGVPDESAWQRVLAGGTHLSALRECDLPPPGDSERVMQWWEEMHDDMSFHLGVPLPGEWTNAEGCRGSSAMFHRPHLPHGFIATRTLPVLVRHAPPYFAMPVPVAYWPDGLLEWMVTQGQGVSNSNAAAEAARQRREAACTSILGPIRKVAHPLETKQPHVDVYQFQWDGPDLCA